MRAVSVSVAGSQRVASGLGGRALVQLGPEFLKGENEEVGWIYLSDLFQL